MTRKIVFGGVLAGLAIFAWGVFSHIVLPIGQMGVKAMPNEDAVMAAMKANIKEPGFYFFPGDGAMPSATLPKDEQETAKKEWQRKYEAGPRGVMVYHPTGENPMSPRQMIFELLSNIVVGLIAALVLAMASDRVRSFAGRVGFVAMLGVMAWVGIEFSYWNWYGFPVAYGAGQFIDQVVGMTFAGFVLALVMRRV